DFHGESGCCGTGRLSVFAGEGTMPGMERRQMGPRKAAHYRATGAVTPISPVTGCVLLALCIALAGCGRKDTRPSPPQTASPAPQRDWQVLAPGNPAAANAVLMRAISLVG